MVSLIVLMLMKATLIVNIKEKNLDSDTSSDDSNGKGHTSVKSFARDSSIKKAHVDRKFKERK